MSSVVRLPVPNILLQQNQRQLEDLNNKIGEFSKQKLTPQILRPLFSNLFPDPAIFRELDTNFAGYINEVVIYINNISKKAELILKEKTIFFNSQLSEKQLAKFNNVYRALQNSGVYSNSKYSNLEAFFTALLIFELQERSDTDIGLKFYKDGDKINMMVVGGPMFLREFIENFIKNGPDKISFSLVKQEASKQLDIYVNASEKEKRKIEYELFKKDITPSITSFLSFLGASQQILTEFTRIWQDETIFFMQREMNRKWDDEQRLQSEKAKKANSDQHKA